MKASSELRRLMAEAAPVVAPGAYAGLSARLVERAGFPAVYLRHGWRHRPLHRPDLGLIGLPEIVARLEEMVCAVSIPLIADADTGYGNALNAQQAVRAFERAGVAGFHLEDQVFPKRCGHCDDKSIVPRIASPGMLPKLRSLPHR